MKKNTVKCPYCGYVFIPDKSDIDYIDKIPMYWCKNENCGEQFVEELEIKNNINYNSKREWQ
jgi:hypothetical protein